MQNPADVVINDAAGQAWLAVPFDYGIQRLLVEEKPLVETAAGFVENGEIVPGVGCQLRRLAELSGKD